MSPMELTALINLLTEVTPVLVNLVDRTLSPGDAKIKFEDIISKIDFDQEFTDKTTTAHNALRDALGESDA